MKGFRKYTRCAFREKIVQWIRRTCVSPPSLLLKNLFPTKSRIKRMLYKKLKHTRSSSFRVSYLHSGTLSTLEEAGGLSVGGNISFAP